MTVATNFWKLWFWPWEAAQIANRFAETATATQSVVAARLPVISAAMTNPLDADHRELSLMVSEKVDAFGRSQRSVADAGREVGRAVSDNTRDLSRLAGGSLLGPADWLTMFERNLAIATTLMTLPMRAMKPVHKEVTANARRLGRR